MRKGIVVTAQAGVENLAVEAERLGFDSFWVYDTPMLHGDPFLALGMCAKATSRIKLGVGVTSPVLRSAPAAANHFASLNAVAPGRVICGIGTGNTARRTLGMPPAKVAEVEAFTTLVQQLCAGRPGTYREGDRVREIEFMHVGPYVNTTDPIEFVLSVVGPKVTALAGKCGAGLVTFGLLDPGAWSALGQVHQAATREAGHRAPGRSYAMTALHVLGDREDRHGPAAQDAMGHIALSLLLFAAENPSFAALMTAEENTAVQQLVARRGATEGSPKRHRMLYRNYLGRIAPEDRDLVTPSLIDKAGLVGTPSELCSRISELEKSGVDELVIQPVVDPFAEMTAFAELPV